MDTSPDPALERYAEAARRVDAGDAGDGCSSGPFGAVNYDDLAGLPDAAVQVSLGCGNPVAVADLHPGETVLDLGSGGGIDVLLSARRVGPTGFAYGLDATVEMLELARRNATDDECHQRRVPPRHDRADPPRRRVGRCRHLELRHRAVRQQGRHVRRDRPCAPPRWPRRDQRHRPRRTRRRHTHHRHLRRRRHHRDDLRGRVASRRARPRRGRADRCDRCRAVQRHHPRRQAGRRDPSAARRRLGGGAAHLRGRNRDRHRHLRDRGAELGALGRQPPRRPPSRRHRSTRSWSGGPRSARSRTAARTPASPRTASTSTPTTAAAASAPHLLDALVSGAERAGYWTIQTGIFPENTASIAIHERVGFRIVGRRERIGQLDGVWRDTLFLERRSARI